MSIYCILDQTYSVEPCSSGWAPKLPEEIPFLQLASPNPDSHWALYRCEFDDEDNLDNSIMKVSDHLEQLLLSAERFPPAMAMARDKIRLLNAKKNPSKTEFLQSYQTCLSECLQCQRNNAFIFAEAVKSELGYLRKDGFYWLIGFNNKENKVHWVSDDYFIYSNAAEYFAVNQADIKQLEANKWDL